MERKYFGTDGIRGVANRAPMTSEVALALGRALTISVRQKTGHRTPKIVIGKDTRLSGYMLECAMASGICSMGGSVILVGPLPTPGISFITASMRADAGVVISASHNPYTDNGIKLFQSDGFKLPDPEEAAIEALMERDDLLAEAPTGDRVGQASRIDDAVGRYVVQLKHTLPKEMTLEGIKIVVDCANGAAYRTAPAVLHEVEKRGADLGITLDGDADRVILLDEKGAVVDGDAVMALCAREMLKTETLVHKTLVTTVMSNLGLDLAVRGLGGRVARTRVGDRYVVEAMRDKGYNFGGEQSGHLIFLDHAATGDGMLAALQIIAIMLKENRPLSELAHSIMDRVPQSLVSFAVPKKLPLETLPSVQKAIASVEAALGEKGRVLVRYSGTENKGRVLVEGPDQATIDAQAKELQEALIKALS